MRRPRDHALIVSKKSKRIAEFTARFNGGGLSPHYLGYFDCFNRQLFYEAHDVLEELWLADRRGPDGDFFKGLIQLAGAFVHVQKNRPGPAGALLQLARANLEKYPRQHLELDLTTVFTLIANWSARVETPSGDIAGWITDGPPRLALLWNGGQH